MHEGAASKDRLPWILGHLRVVAAYEYGTALTVQKADVATPMAETLRKGISARRRVLVVHCDLKGVLPKGSPYTSNAATRP